MTKRPVVVFALLLVNSPVMAAISGPVRTASGLVSGIAGSDPAVLVFEGIPFAAPPVGDLRWRAPKPAASWTGVRKADRMPAGCIQNVARSRNPWTEEFMHLGAVSEDCLYLNVWTAASSGSEKRPVFVWIYGGGFNEGSNSVAAYDGEQLAKKGLVVVVMNYRVGVLGFLAHPELTKESDVNASGNYGLLDQFAALQWVQKNIAGFGGDPTRVTIAGQSAGAMSVHDMTLSPLAKGLFVRAIAESGSAVGRRMTSLRDAEQEGVQFAEAKGAHSMRELRARPAGEVAARVEGRQFGFRPVADGWFLPVDAKQNDVPMLTGLTADEGSSSPTYGKMTPEEFEKQAQQRFGDSADSFLKLYPVESQKNGARDQGLISMYVWAKNRARTARTNAYIYYWDHAMPGPLSSVYGAFHSSEVPYVFNSLKKINRPWTPEDWKIAEMMSSYWANFASTGDPNGSGLPIWPAFNVNRAVIMEVGDKTGPRPMTEDKARREFLEAYFSKMAGR